MMSKILQLSNQKKVHYIEQGHGEPLLLLHGVGMRAEAWEPQIAYFSKNYKVIAVDLPGHGESDALLSQKDLPDYVDWAVEVIEQLNLGKVNIAGHSMGSLITLGVSVTRPDLVKRMAVLNSVYKRTPEAREAVVKRAEELEDGILDIETPISRWFINNSELAKTVEGWLKKVNLDGYGAAYKAFAEGDSVYADQWSNVVCPALILTGTEDHNSTEEMAKKMHEQAGNSELVILENERHMANLTAPILVNEALSRWLQQNENIIKN